MIKILSWNLNGLGSCFKKGGQSFIESIAPDIVCCQESRAERTNLGLLGYKLFWNVSKRPGYAGALVASKARPINVTYGIGNADCDSEGRCTTLEFNDFVIINVYVPNCRSNSLERYHFRQVFDDSLHSHIQSSMQYKPVIICGDFNVAHKFLDLNAESERSVENPPGFLTDDRDNFDRILNLGFVDAFRFKYPNERAYTWFGSYKNKELQISIGTRIDYFLVSESLKNGIVDVNIHSEVACSDHRPLELLINIK